MLEVLLVAGSLALSNFAASIAIGISGVDRGDRIRVGLAFGLFEAGMPVIGLLIGRDLAHALGGAARIIGGLLLIAVGAQTTYSAFNVGDDRSPDAIASARLGRLVLLAAALSIDNLVVGFALGANHPNLLLSVIVITAASVGLSLVGLELGSRLGAQIEHNSEILGGVVLAAVGVAVLTGLL